jgi:hypothetical protein
MVDWWWSPTKSGDREEEDDADPDLRCPGIMYACVPGFCVFESALIYILLSSAFVAGWAFVASWPFGLLCLAYNC